MTRVLLAVLSVAVLALAAAVAWLWACMQWREDLGVGCEQPARTPG
jgi:hypothetical protein